MRSFKNFFNEKVESAYGIRPKSGDEQDFMDKHVVDVIDHPLNDKETLNGTKNSPGKKKRKADYDQESGEDVYESKDGDEDEDEDDDDLDPVNKKDVKKKFKDREDKDIDNDGDEDESDEYLHKRRKAVSKAIEKVKEEVGLDEVSKSTQYRRDNPKTKYRLTMRNGSTKVVTADSADSAKDQGGYNVAKVEKVLGEAGYLSFSRPGALKDKFGTKAINDYKAMKTMLVVDPKDPHAKRGGGVKKINAKDWPKYEKMGFIMAEDFQEEVTFDDLNNLAQTMRD